MKYYTFMGSEFNEWRKIISYFSYLFNDCKSAIFLIRSKNANQVMMVKGRGGQHVTDFAQNLKHETSIAKT